MLLFCEFCCSKHRRLYKILNPRNDSCMEIQSSDRSEPCRPKHQGILSNYFYAFVALPSSLFLSNLARPARQKHMAQK